MPPRTRRDFLRTAAAGALVASGVGTSGQANAAASLDSAVDALVAKAGITGDAPGLAILVKDQSRVLFQKAYGLARLSPATPVTTSTLFELASVSKTFTATAILTLLDKGALALDDDVRTYVPELPRYYRTGVIQVRDLLQHTSGLPDYVDVTGVTPANGRYLVNTDFIRAFGEQVSTHPASFSAGAKYEYCNSNYLLLATIVERVSRKSFGAYVHDTIFVPAGMTHSVVYQAPTSLDQYPDPSRATAIGYERTGGTRSAWKASWGTVPDRLETTFVVGDGNLWSNLGDLAKWDDIVRSGRLLSTRTRALALTPSTTRDGRTNDYGLGWMLYYDRPSVMIGYGHDGEWSGFNTSYYNYLAGGRTTVLLSNRGDFDADAFWDALNGLF